EADVLIVAENVRLDGDIRPTPQDVAAQRINYAQPLVAENGDMGRLQRADAAQGSAETLLSLLIPVDELGVAVVFVGDNLVELDEPAERDALDGLRLPEFPAGVAV